jgi:uncharacterized protein YceH (UPF0502 family)
MEPDAVEIRVLGCLVEKQRTERLHHFANLVEVHRALEREVAELRSELATLRASLGG